MKVLIFVLLFFSYNCFSQHDSYKLNLIDSLCKSYIWKAPICSIFFHGMETNGRVSKVVYTKTEDGIDIACIDNKTIDTLTIIKIVFNEDVLYKRKWWNSQAELYYADGKPFFIKIHTKSNKWFQKNREYEFSFADNKIPDNVDSKTRNLLKSYLKELPNYVNTK